LLGLAVATWSASAALGLATMERDAASSAPPPVRDAAAPAEMTATVAVAGPLGLDRRADVDVPALPLGGLLPAERTLDTGTLPLGARVQVDLASERVGGAGSGSASQAYRVREQRTQAVDGASLAVAASAFTLAGLAAYFWGGLKKALLLPLVGLYARITRAEVFDNTVRERIFHAIKANPGLSASDLAKLAGVSWGTTIYHLDVLEQNRMVTSLRKGRHRRYFENGAALTVPKEAVAVLQNPVTAQVVSSIQGQPGATQKELAGRVGLTPQALHWHLQRLVAVGLVRKEREGRVVRHFSQ
ncbi:MAG TPA: winged helix-turn-helix transcriptional regulator, partial [Candidatus Thermoplasmatota archaeon]|nr:winged helix-turn-helix transcriptional regulator [Candidatus Thermoplasmatota archaeon]